MNKDHTVDAVTVGLVSGAGLLACALMLTGDHGALHAGPTVTRFVGVLCLVTAWQIARSLPGRSAEADVWRAFSRGAGAFGVGLLLEAGIQGWRSSGYEGSDLHGVGIGLGALVGCSFLYHGMIRWNQFRGLDADSGDWLNGFSAVLVVVAAGALVIGSTSSKISAWPALGERLWLAHLGAVIVLAGTLAAAASLGGRLRDPRVLMIAASLGLSGVLQVLAGVLGDARFANATTEVSWVLVVCVLGICSRVPPAPLSERGGPSQSPTIGSFVVLIATMVVLGVNAVAGADRASTAVLATAAGLCTAARFLYLIRDLGGLEQSKEEARTDDLTGIANRRALSGALTAAASGAEDAALLIVDLDRFKDVNDHYGHAVGDEVLRSLVVRLQNTVPAGGLLGRLGGDEFAVLLRGAPVLDATRIAWALVEACTEPVVLSAGRLSLGASVGVATTAFGGHRDGELIRRADAAMYVAKRAGGGVSTYDADADLRAKDEHQRLEELRHILGPDASELDHRQIVVHYQPQLASSGAVVGVEALVRWQHPVLGLLAPDAFLDLVERHGMMVALTRLVLGSATAEAARWHRSGHRIRVAVNLSTSCLGHPDLLPMLENVLVRTRIDVSLLTLEITETTIMSDPELALEVTRAIAARGIGISIDDYGTGYSSLTYLNDLPAAELKLDRSFTARLIHEPRTAAIVAGTIDLAHGLGLRFIAEGVEDERTLIALRKLGCDETQGYLHARPMPANQFRVWLAQASAPSDAPTPAA